MVPTPTPGFIAPAAPAIGVGVAGAGVAAAAAAAAVAAAAPVAAMAVGAAALGVGIFAGANFLAQSWGYFNGRDKPNKNNKLPNGIGVDWSGPSGSAGQSYKIEYEWPIKAADSPGATGSEITLRYTDESAQGPFDGAMAETSSTATKRGKWTYGVTREGDRISGSYWDANRNFYSGGEGALKVRVIPLGDPALSPKPAPYTPAPPPYAPEPLPELEPQKAPKPRPKAPPPLPQVPPDPRPLPPVAPPSPNPAPAPNTPQTPQPGSPAPSPVPGSEQLPNTGKAPAAKPGAIVKTDKNAHYIAGGRVGGSGFGPGNLVQTSKELGRIEQKLAMMLSPLKGGNNYLQLLLGIYNYLNQILPPVEYSLTEKCEPCGDGTDQPCPGPIYSDQLPINFNAFQGIAERLDAVAGLIDAQLGARQVTCSTKRPELRGDWVTVRFESDGPSEMGTRPLRKLLRYRSESGKSIGQLSDYWAPFTWTAGNVCVIHKGASWGTPQCWAESADEGKRVIRFAAAESGLDPDAVGQWTVSFSRNPRFGQRGSMRVKSIEGFPAVTSRDGSDGLPVVARPET